jgi:hypothetical protein
MRLTNNKSANKFFPIGNTGPKDSLGAINDLALIRL